MPVLSGLVMPTFRFTIPRLPAPVLEHGRLFLQSFGHTSRWTAFMAGLWLRRRGPAACALRQAAFLLALVVLQGCTELAQPSEAASPVPPASYVSLVAKYLSSAFKDRSNYQGFEISKLRWVVSFKGWAWLACVRYQDRGQTRMYALFIQDNSVVDARYAVETDACGTQTYTQFDLVTGVLGQPTVPTQPALY
jgi:hypothetical protein